jgi:hypothetical protein
VFAGSSSSSTRTIGCSCREVKLGYQGLSLVRRLRGTLSEAGGVICDPRIVLVQSFTRIRIGFCCCTAPLFVTDCHREQVRPKGPLLFN